jgi:replicative DNA helicase
MSLEMPGYEVTKLLYATMMGVNDLRLRSSSNMSREEKSLFEATQINEMLLGIECKSGLNLPQVIKRIVRYSRMGYKIIFIDYLQRIAHNRNNQASELEDICIKIADAARQNNIAIVLLSQLNAMAEREAPNMGQLKGSGGIGETADTIILFDNLYRRTKHDADKGKIDLYLEQRYGDSGKLTIFADLGSCSFRDLTERNPI